MSRTKLSVESLWLAAVQDSGLENLPEHIQFQLKSAFYDGAHKMLHAHEWMLQHLSSEQYIEAFNLLHGECMQMIELVEQENKEREAILEMSNAPPKKFFH